jgi:hypothetical protein
MFRACYQLTRRAGRVATSGRAEADRVARQWRADRLELAVEEGVVDSAGEQIGEARLIARGQQIACTIAQRESQSNQRIT